MNAEAVVLLSAWEFDADVDPLAVARAARDDLHAPDLELLVISESAQFLIVHVLEGELRDGRSVLYVEGRGRHRITCTEEPLPRATDDRCGMRLTLAPIRHE